MTIPELLADYTYRRARAEEAAAERRAEALLNFPALDALEKKKREAMLGLLAQSAQGSVRPELLAKAREEAAALDRQATEFLQQNGLGDFAPRYACALCQDTGYVERAGKKEYCPCLLMRAYESLFGATSPDQAPGSFEAFDETLFCEKSSTGRSPRSQICAARKLLEGYIAAFPAPPRPNVVLIGKAGLGKSFLLNATAKELEKKEPAVFLTDAFSLFSVFHKHRLGEISSLELIFDAPVLLVDDLGAEPMTQNVTREYLTRLLDRRAQNRLPTLFATNLFPEELASRYGERISSRLLEESLCMKLVLTGEDIRLKK